MGITSIYPNRLLWTPQAILTIQGARFTEGTRVFVGEKECLSLERRGSGTLICSPEHVPPGIAALRVVSGSGESSTLTSGVQYLSAVAVYCSSTAQLHMFEASTTGVLSARGMMPAPAAVYGGFDTRNRMVSLVAAPNIVRFAINPYTLAPAAGVNTTSLTGANGFAMDNAGTALFSSQTAGTTFGYHPVLATGELGPLSSISGAASASKIAVSPNGAYVVTYYTPNEIEVWRANGENTTSQGRTAIGGVIGVMEFTPDSRHLVLSVGSVVKVFPFNPSTGVLGSAKNISVPSAVVGLRMHPNSSYFYVSTTTDIYTFEFEPSVGAFQKSAHPYASAGKLAVDGSGRFVYALNTTDVFVAPILNDGTLGAYTAAITGLCITSGGITASY